MAQREIRARLLDDTYELEETVWRRSWQAHSEWPSNGDLSDILIDNHSDFGMNEVPSKRKTGIV